MCVCLCVCVCIYQPIILFGCFSDHQQERSPGMLEQWGKVTPFNWPCCSSAGMPDPLQSLELFHLSSTWYPMYQNEEGYHGSAG